MTQYVYRFGGGVSDGGTGDKNLLGGKGANLAEMASIGLPVPPGFTITTEMCTRYYEGRRTLSRQPARRSGDRHRAYRRRHREAFRRYRRSAARLGPVRRAGVDAGDDGYGAQPRPQRRNGRGAGQAFRTIPASPGTAIAASFRCMPMSCSAWIMAGSRKRWKSPRRTRAISSIPK